MKLTTDFRLVKSTDLRVFLVQMKTFLAMIYLMMNLAWIHAMNFALLGQHEREQIFSTGSNVLY